LSFEGWVIPSIGLIKSSRQRLLMPRTASRVASCVSLIPKLALLPLAVGTSSCSSGSTTQQEHGTVSARQAVVSGGLSTANLQLQVLTQSCVTSQVQQKFKITNNGTSAVALSDFKIKYWVDETSTASIVPRIDHGGCRVNASGCYGEASGVSATAARLGSTCGLDSSHQANWQITVSNTDAALLQPGEYWENIQTSVHRSDWQSFSPGTSQWYSPCLTGYSYTADSHFGLYYKGDLVYAAGIGAPSCAGPHGKQPLSGYVTADIAAAPLIGPVPANTVVSVSVGLPVTVPTDGNPTLEDFAKGVSSADSPNYRQYIDVPTFAARYGSPSTGAISDWATARGLTVTKTFENHLLLAISGSAAALGKALYANLVYRQRADGSQFVSVDREPSLDSAVSVLWISGLTDFKAAKLASGSGAPNCATQGANYPTCSTDYFGKDFRNAYALPSSRQNATCSFASNLDGFGQSLGILAFWDYSDKDVADFRAAAGVSSTVNVERRTTPGVSLPSLTGDERREFTMDIEAALSMAPNLKNLFVFGTDRATPASALTQVATTQDPTGQAMVKQTSSSWMFDLDANAKNALLQMAAQGQSFFVCSGDFIKPEQHMAKLTRDDVRLSPWATVVGGTLLTMNGAGASYISEMPWGFCTTAGCIQDGSVGGYSDKDPGQPSYQKNANIIWASNRGSPSHRNFPDVAMVAGNFVIRYFNAWQGLGGTSFASPLWAGYMALVNQESEANGLPPVGFANPVLYAIGNSKQYEPTFNDIRDDTRTHGTDFFAVPGFDLVTGWGSPTCNLIGQLAAHSPAPPKGVATGNYHACAVRDDNSIWCWGRNYEGQLGTSSQDVNPCSPASTTCWVPAKAHLPSPVGNLPVPTTNPPVSLSAGVADTCAAFQDGTVKCWGLLVPPPLPSINYGATPVQVNGITSALQVEAGYLVNCALLSGGTIKCWGNNAYGQLGNSSYTWTSSSASPVEVSGIDNATAISAGLYSACALTTAGGVQCWGWNDHGQLGNGTTAGSLVPVSVSDLTNAVDITVGANHACALLETGGVVCWGYNIWGQLGDGTTMERHTPVVVQGVSTAKQIAAFQSGTCAMLTDGTVTCWGTNSGCALGNGNVPTSAGQSTAGTSVAYLKDVLTSTTGTASSLRAISGGAIFSCAVVSNAIECWGSDSTGELGDGQIETMRCVAGAVHFIQ
jgi:alpha-tubulin suppressor-like RCC1 family protein